MTVYYDGATGAMVDGEGVLCSTPSRPASELGLQLQLVPPTLSNTPDGELEESYEEYDRAAAYSYFSAVAASSVGTYALPAAMPEVLGVGGFGVNLQDEGIFALDQDALYPSQGAAAAAAAGTPTAFAKSTLVDINSGYELHTDVEFSAGELPAVAHEGMRRPRGGYATEKQDAAAMDACR
ncbi:uncharacterized protein Ecym_2133 [Eremothecium cymbalariae DBVPG|uniref:Uncharacterized protein n=1 Tax=Eremothecium cymbalariae (strain CBS 270.75 / DBVPG 7215 / KCTC 17166 / NRRL Y-17582) TaxID=931890 RepID=G8JNG9_ERECY|nr:Hypothetical protein Ecym_2133 [Eremothecium cymbalariae DBVPG\